MQTHKLVGKPRTVLGKKVKRYRKDGFIPAVLYGGKHKGAVPILVGEKDFLKVYKEAGVSSLVSLQIGQDDIRKVLVHDMTRHALTNRFLHIDFYEVRMDEKLKAKVPLVYVGESSAVKNEGGMLVRAMQDIEVECLPQDLPRELEVDISLLKKFHDMVRVKDIKLPKGVSVEANLDVVIALVEEPRTESELEKLSEAPEEQAAISQIKVVGEEERNKKKEEAVQKEENLKSPSAGKQAKA
ncbi:MAG: 50S ribosomal protein L25 [bacterium]|nr:50S ribosomal protein L25 [bacterium]